MNRITEDSFCCKEFVIFKSWKKITAECLLNFFVLCSYMFLQPVTFKFQLFLQKSVHCSVWDVRQWLCHSSSSYLLASHCSGWVWTRVWSCGICGGQSGARAAFLRVLQSPLPFFIPPVAPQSPSSIIWGWYNRPVVAAVPSGLSLTPVRIKKKTVRQHARLICMYSEWKQLELYSSEL
jgi:hypothetical protein